MTDEKPDDRFSDAWFAHVRANLKKHWAREDEEKRLLGGIDEETLACYHLGLSTPQERQRVDDAKKQFPAIGEALELLRQVDAEWQDEGASGITTYDSQRKQSEENRWTDRTGRSNQPPKSFP